MSTKKNDGKKKGLKTDQEKIKHYLSKKCLFGTEKKEPVWVYLEREMRENVHKKPYNEKVGSWLKFLKELRWFFHCEAIAQANGLAKAVGPVWFTQMSILQVKTLKGLHDDIHRDLIEDLPRRTQRALYDLGISPRFPNKTVMAAMAESDEDPGLFVWYLYKRVFGYEPCVPKKSYTMNMIILMSALVFIDLEECIMELEKLAYGEKPPPPPPKPKPPPNKVPRTKFGLYLQRPDIIPLVEPQNACGRRAKEKPNPLHYKFRVRSETTLQELKKNTAFLQLRADRMKPKKEDEKVCTYNFWTPPTSLRAIDNPAMLILKVMFRRKPAMRVKSQYDNLQYHVGGVAYIHERPYYILNSAVTIQTEFIPINGGLVMTEEGYCITQICGLTKIPEENPNCNKNCKCLQWYNRILKYLEDTKCTCGHHYDYYNEGKTKAKFFCPSTRHVPFFFDQAKIFMMDSTMDFIKETVQNAVRSVTPDTLSSAPSINAAKMSMKHVLNSFLADLGHTALIIPHLPDAASVPILLEWCRRRLQGECSNALNKQDFLRSKRKWLQLSHMNFKTPAYVIPFTQEELHEMTWAQRKLIQKLFLILLDSFVYRNRVLQLQQARLMFATLMYEKHPNIPFLECFYTYMPGRLWDTYLINPYSTLLTKTHGAKTCPL